MDQINALVAAGLSVHFVDDGDFTHRATCKIAHKDGTSGVKGQGKDPGEALTVALQSARAAGLVKADKPADVPPPPKS